MNNITHDPLEYVRGLQQILVSDKKKIAFLFGAGTSLAKKNNKSLTVPGIAKLTEMVELELQKTKKFKDAINEVKIEIGEKAYNIEALLTNFEQKKQIIGNSKLNNLDSQEIDQLLLQAKEKIREIVSVHKEIIANDGYNDMIHVDFAEWIGRADRKYPIEIFTTNYDYFFELGMEKKNIPYYDGFTGSFDPFFFSESVEDLCCNLNQTKLWKIHGSLGWHLDSVNNKVLRKDSDENDILIYPSILKYNNSKKQPYIALIDRLTNFLKQPDTILIVCGYSFGDEHINERIIAALKTNTTAHVCGLYYDTVWKDGKKDGYLLSEDSNIATLAKGNNKISILGSRSAVIGGCYGEWQLKREPDKEDTIHVNLYFAEDGPINPEVEEKVEHKGDEIWNGKGELILPDFSKFVRFLQSMILFSNINTDGRNDK